MKLLIILLLILCTTILAGCKQDQVFGPQETEYLIIVVVDGPRYSETWGDPNHTFIPNQHNLLSEGVFFDHFYNDGPTFTVPGHMAITTGSHQDISNSGTELPKKPGLFQIYRKATGKEASKTWIVASKDKLEVLSNCTNNKWENTFMPLTNCGINGLGSGYREDSITISRFFQVLNFDHPNIALLNFKDPDNIAHQQDWNGYLNSISKTDQYIQEIWEFIQNDPIYQGKTTLIITNDHGRHLDNVAGGYVEHGDDCDGCKHISLLAIGPDFKKGVVNSDRYNQTDLSRTLAYLMQVNLHKPEGKVIYDIFK